MLRTILFAMTGLLMVGSAQTGLAAEPDQDCVEEGKFAQVIEACTEVIRQSPENARAYKVRGNAYREMDKSALALADFNKAIALDPKYADAYAGCGKARPQGQEGRAMADFNKAIELDPKNAQAYFYRSDFHSVQFPQRTIADLGKAIELDRKFVAAYIARGMKYAEMNQRARAKADFAKAIEINAEAAQVIGWVHPDIVDEIKAEGRANPR